MFISIVRWVAVVALCLIGTTNAKGVFAHYMVVDTHGHHFFSHTYDDVQVGDVTQDHANQDIDDAIAVG